MYHRDSPWDSDAEMGSDTSTPAYKRGKHTVRDRDRNKSEKGDITQGNSHPISKTNSELSDLEIVAWIKQEGLVFPMPAGVQKRKPSVLVLADAQLKFWPEKDPVCRVVCHPHWPLRRWSHAVHLGTISIDCHTVVLYLEGTRNWQDVPPIKNALTLLNKVIHSHGENPRIFISNHLPRPGRSPLQYPILQSQFHSTTSNLEYIQSTKGGSV